MVCKNFSTFLVLSVVMAIQLCGTYRFSRWRDDDDVCDVRKYPLPIVPP